MTRAIDSISWEVIPGTDINEIRQAHPDWTEDQCREEQHKAAVAAFMSANKRRAS